MNTLKNLNFEQISELVKQERDRQKSLSLGGDTDDFDTTLSANDFIALANSYLGRAVQKSFRNEKENQNYQENMIKAITLLFASLENNETSLK